MVMWHKQKSLGTYPELSKRKYKEYASINSILHIPLLHADIILSIKRKRKEKKKKIENKLIARSQALFLTETYLFFFFF